MSTAVLPDERVATSTADGDHDRYKHWIVTLNIGDGRALALCGKKWHPKDVGAAETARLTMCPDCDRLYQLVPKGGDG